MLSDQFRKEQKDYYLHTSQWTDIHPQQVMGPPACFKHYDLHTLTLDDLKVCKRSGSRGAEQGEQEAVQLRGRGLVMGPEGNVQSVILSCSPRFPQP